MGVRPILERSGLPVDTLRQVWNLSDIDRDGQLDSDEFAVAMHLTRERGSTAIVARHLAACSWRPTNPAHPPLPLRRPARLRRASLLSSSPRVCPGEAAAVLWCLPKVANAAAHLTIAL